MASFFNVVLDTTGPATVAASINGGAAYVTTRAVTLATTTTDTPTTGYEMKVWGDVDTSANASIQTLEASSAWIPYTASQGVTLSTGEGSKTVSVRLRDDVYNPSSAATASVTLDTTAPVITIQVGSPDVAKVSEQTTKNTVTVVWQSNEALAAYEIAVVANGAAARGTGTVIGTAAGSTNVSGGAVAATTNVTSTIKATDIKTAAAGDGTKVVKIFGRDQAGNWSAA